MNGKEPAKTMKKTIDIGDVWYQVGEGSLLAKSVIVVERKRGNSSQKYVHHFNEETKDWQPTESIRYNARKWQAHAYYNWWHLED